MKILAMYLPQFHEIKENNRWWGKGYTEWTAVKKAKKYYSSHRQPRVPMNLNYYDLADKTGAVWKWQADLANQYGVYGFCIYHYWFSSETQLLEKPMEILLEHPEINLRYCICWANETWKRTWYGVKRDVLMEQKYGDVYEWDNHFKYLLPFFKDERYIKVKNKPVVHIYRSFDIPCLREMMKEWNELAKENGFDGVYLIVGNTGSKKREMRTDIVEAYYNYEPSHVLTHLLPMYSRLQRKSLAGIRYMMNWFRKNKILLYKENADTLYKYVTKELYFQGKKCFLGTFASYDDTPRRQHEGHVIESTPKKFKKNLLEIKDLLKLHDRQDDFVYLTAWNEWGEGAYLEPDEDMKYGWLECIENIMRSD